MDKGFATRKTDMKYFMIKYRFETGSREDWHRVIAAFIAAVDADPALKGISYRCMKRRDSDEYFHIAAVANDQSVKALQSSSFFAGYQDKTKEVSGGKLEVFPLDILGETAMRG
jgi:hypothetical protein